MGFIKVYCTAAEKKDIQAKAKSNAQNTSKYLKERGLNDLHERVTIAELTSCMIHLIDADSIGINVKEELLEIAQSVLEGASISTARARISEVCHFANQGYSRL
jgi:hypothetical protein